MANNEKPQGDPWIWLFLVVLLAILLTSRGGGLFGGSGIRFGSPSSTGTVDEELSSRPSSGGAIAPSPAPLPAPTPTAIKDQITLQAFGSTRLGLEEEYVQITAKSVNKNRVVITGFVLKNRNNESAEIGKDEFGSAISLNPGERAVIATAQSPRGFNFKVNKCSGYLAQSKTYTPGLPFFCPRAADLSQVRDLTENCQRFIERMASCTTPVINFASGIDNKCSTFIGEHANYAGCVKDFKNDPDFDQKEWRIYFGRTREFWSNLHDNIRLFDQFGNLISEVSY